VVSRKKFGKLIETHFEQNITSNGNLNQEIRPRVINHVAVIKAKEPKGSIEWSFLLESKCALIEISTLENIHHCEVDEESQEDE
jgi:hypothetical protein